LDGFPDEQNQNTMEEFQSINEWSKKKSHNIEDKRLKIQAFWKRLIYQNQPEVLSKDEYNEIQKDIAKKDTSV
jgi:hypothetical protein